MSANALQPPSSAPPPCSPMRSQEQTAGASIGPIASLPIRPPSNSLNGPFQMTPREYGSSRPDSWHPALMGSYGMRPPGYPMSEGIPRWDGQEYESCEPHSMAAPYSRPDPRGWQPPYEPCDIPNVLTIRLREIVNLLPLSENLYDPKGLYYEIIPVVQSPNQQILDASGERMGPFLAERSDHLWRVGIDSPVLRFAYNPNKLYHFKIVEADHTTRNVMGVATLSLTPDGPDIAISQNPLVPPEQIINHPQFRRSFAIAGRDAIHRGELVLSMLFDYLRPGECLWPSEAYLAKMEGEMRPPSDTRSTSAEMGGSVETQRSSDFPHQRRRQPARVPYMPVTDYDEEFNDRSFSWWDIIGPELTSMLKTVLCIEQNNVC